MRAILLVILAVLVDVTAGVYATFARDMIEARARLLSRSNVIETSFGTMEYAAVGKGETILIVHGAAGGFDQGLDMAGALAALRIPAHHSVPF